MKKLMIGLLTVIALSSVAFSAQESAKSSEAAPAARPVEKAFWPVWLAFNSTKNIDVIGLRLTLPYGNCESVTGFDLGLFGRCRYFEGLQLNILRNDVTDIAAGFQLGLYNSVGRGDLLGVQVGLWNEAQSFRGIQVGLINLAESGQGFQIGLINRTEAFYGFQIGLINVIRSSEIPFFPVINIGF